MYLYCKKCVCYSYIFGFCKKFELFVLQIKQRILSVGLVTKYFVCSEFGQSTDIYSAGYSKKMEVFVLFNRPTNLQYLASSYCSLDVKSLIKLH